MVRKILRNILQGYPFKIKHIQELVPADLPKREDFALQFLARMKVHNPWPWTILWTHGAHSHLQGSVNTQNYRIRARDNPFQMQPLPLHSKKSHCVTRVYGSIYRWPFLFRGDWAFGFCYLYSQWDTL
ncbi:hypothetical protein AVEN_81820-1 [Araneus ventricosus]|uniref:Uncharacterized protein n=1 Tax=Araneus ventricosus TaxID=182803 RepID=A0A4Y2NXM7_ARAVE|nr:hypothetical protein AVEN_81820-1 [Araneus ventricosus]